MSILFDPASKRFNLLGARSVYAFEIDAAGALVHVAWGPRPEGTPSGLGLSGHLKTDSTDYVWDYETRPDELVAFGEVATHEVSLKVSFAGLAGKLAKGEAMHLPVRDVRLRYAGHALVAGEMPGLAPAHGLPVREGGARETLRVTLRDTAYPFAVNLFYRLTPEHDIVERWCELVNEGGPDVAVEICNFATAHLPAGHYELTRVEGCWGREFTPARFRLPIGVTMLENRGLQTGHNHNPFFMLNAPGQAWEETGTVYFGALAYSGNWRLAVEQLHELPLRIHGGYHTHDFGFTLKAGEKHRTPAMLLGVSDAGWGGASRRLHRLLRERVLPAPEAWAGGRPVLYNSWEATYFDVNFEGQVELARRAAAMGVELFCVDDGWFGARRHERAGLGDWVASSEAFPGGLEPLVAEVRRLGMKFGLWVEPEMVNPDSDLYRAHPDWVLHFPGRPRTEKRNQLILDFGRPEVVSHILAVLDDLVGRYGIDFFKWDMNRCVAEPGSVAGREIWFRHVAGVYHIMDELRRHPGLSIQSCSGGGGRIDAGVLGRTDQAWLSDNTCAFDRLRIQEGFSLAYPARAMECWVTDSKNHQTGVPSSLAHRFDVAMRGVLGIGSNLRDLGEAELEEYRRHIAFYKRIRPVIQDGDLYRLERLEQHGRSIWLYVAPGAREAVYTLAVRDAVCGILVAPPPLRGLLPACLYRVLDRNGAEVVRATGLELMVQGLPGDRGHQRGHSRTLHLVAV